jgi:hypothetical protein
LSVPSPDAAIADSEIKSVLINNNQIKVFIVASFLF